MNNKFEFTGEEKIFLGRTLKRIRAKVSFGVVRKGEIGGWIEFENNVDVSGNAWVSGNAQVFGNAWVSGDAQVYGEAQVFGNAQVSGDDAILWMSKVGSQLGTLTAYRSKQGITVTRGCFIGTLDEFRAKVRQEYGEDGFGKGYLVLANYIEWHFNELHKEAA